MIADKLTALNEASNDLLRKVAIIIVMLGLVAALSFMLPYFAPFVVAALIATLMEPLVRLLTRLFKFVRFARTLAAALVTILVLAIVLALLLVSSSRVISEVSQVAAALPKIVTDGVANATTWFYERLPEWELLDDTIRVYLTETLTSLGKMITSSTTTLASNIAKGMWNAATVTLPTVMLFLTLTFMGAFYMSADKKRILTFISAITPNSVKRGGMTVKDNLLKGLLSQLRASIIMLFVTFIELFIGLSLIKVEYTLLFALIISIVDMLPILGTGLFLLPMSLIGFFSGNFRMGVGSLLIYLINGVVRQTIEPRIIGKGIGLHPLATMMAMYASYKIIGFSGMIAGPIILLIVKAVTELATATPIAITKMKEQPEPTVGTDTK